MKSRIDRFAWIIFWILPVVYFFLYAPYGFSELDPSFIPALSHRVLMGETIGTDFIYVRPPLSPYLHAVELALLPQSLEMIGTRAVYYLMMALSVFWFVRSLEKYMDLEEWGIHPGWLAVAGLILSLHNYPAMAWHTVDGIFFSAAGLFVATRKASHWAVGGGMLLMVIAAMAKQPFALVPVGGVVLLLLTQPFHLVWRGVGIAGGVCALVLAVFLFNEAGREFIQNNLEYVSGSSGLHDLLQAGVVVYKPAIVFGAPYFLLFVAGRFFPKSHYRGWIVFLSVMAGILFWLVFIGVYVHRMESFLPPRYGFYHLLLLISLCTSAWMFFAHPEYRKAMTVLGFMGIIAWTSGISWGYAFPALVAVPGLAGTMLFASTLHDFKLPGWAMPLLSVAAFAGFYFASQYPYQEHHRSELTYHLGDIYPELNHVYTHAERYEKMADFKSLQQRTGPDFAVLPGFPIADYVSHTKPVLPLDWEHDGEMAFEKGVLKVITRLEERDVTVLVEKEMVDEAYSKNKNYRCSVLAHVLEKWQKTDSTEHFLVYRKPEPLPFIYFQF